MSSQCSPGVVDDWEDSEPVSGKALVGSDVHRGEPGSGNVANISFSGTP